MFLLLKKHTHTWANTHTHTRTHAHTHTNTLPPKNPPKLSIWCHQRAQPEQKHRQRSISLSLEADLATAIMGRPGIRQSLSAPGRRRRARPDGPHHMTSRFYLLFIHFIRFFRLPLPFLFSADWSICKSVLQQSMTASSLLFLCWMLFHSKLCVSLS